MTSNVTIGTTVHYMSHGTPVRENGTQAYTSQCRAAIVTAIDDNSTGPTVSLHVFNPDGDFYNHNVPWAWHGITGGALYTAPGGTWHDLH